MLGCAGLSPYVARILAVLTGLTTALLLLAGLTRLFGLTALVLIAHLDLPC